MAKKQPSEVDVGGSISAERTEREFSQSPQAQRGSAQDFTQFGDREVHTDAVSVEDAGKYDKYTESVRDIEEGQANYNKPYADGGGIYSKPRR